MEFVIVNGAVSLSQSTSIEVSTNPFLDDVSFLNDLFNGLYNRSPESFEQTYWVQQLSSGAMTRKQIIEKLRENQEFRKATDALIAHKTVTGEWATMLDLLGSIAMGNATASDDHSDSDENATVVFFNQTVQGRINRENDVDVFRINSLTPGGNDGILTLTMQPGHPLGMVGLGRLDIYSPTGNDFRETYGPFQASEPNGGWQTQIDLSNYTNVDYYTFAVSGTQFPVGMLTDPYLGNYTITLRNTQTEASEAKIALTMMEELSQVLQSPVNDFAIINSDQGGAAYIPSILNGSWYIDQYGAIGTHNPEEFFTRLFQNKYDQLPSPAQRARGIEFLNNSGFLSNNFSNILRSMKMM